MANPEVLAVLMVIAVVAALMAGYPVALTLAGTSLIFAVLGDAIGAMSFGILGALPQRIFGVMTNPTLLAIPLFIFMGVMLERSAVKRLIEPSEVAELVAYLCSPAAASVSGASLAMDGGWTAR